MHVIHMVSGCDHNSALSHGPSPMVTREVPGCRRQIWESEQALDEPELSQRPQQLPLPSLATETAKLTVWRLSAFSPK